MVNEPRLLGGHGPPRRAGQLIRVLMRWLADKLDMGERLQRPVTLYAGLPSLSFFTDAKLRLSPIGPG